MLLAIDVGNTNTVLGIFSGNELIKSWRVKTDARDTADELWIRFSTLLDGYSVDALAICSTVPATLRELRTMVATYFAETPVTIVEPGVKTGVPLLVDDVDFNWGEVLESSSSPLVLLLLLLADLSSSSASVTVR